MDTKEFKAWFEGFTDSIGETPTKEQFDKIKAKVQALDDRPKVTYREPGGIAVPRWLDGQIKPAPEYRIDEVKRANAEREQWSA